MIAQQSMLLDPPRTTTIGDELSTGATESLSLSDSLTCLDKVIKAAIADLESSFERDPSSAEFRGLCVSLNDAAKLLSISPGRAIWSPSQTSSTESRFTQSGETSRLTALGQRFCLDSFEIDALLIAASPDLDQRYERLYGLLQDDVTRRRPTVTTTINLAAARPLRQWQGLARFAANSRLMLSRLVRVVPDPGQNLPTMGSHYVIANEQVVRFLAGLDDLDETLRTYCRVLPAVAAHKFDNTWYRHSELLTSLKVRPHEVPSLRFTGATPWERQHLAHAVASLQSLPLFVVDIHRLDIGTHGAVQDIERALLAARLRGAIAFFEETNTTQEQCKSVHALLQNILSGRDGPCILSSQDADGLHTAAFVEVRLPGAQERSTLWFGRLEQAGLRADQQEIAEVAHEFQLDTEQTLAAAAECVRGYGTQLSRSIPRDLLFAAARRQLGQRLPRTVVGIEPKAYWSDLILTRDATDQLREICTHIRGRPVVFDQWGFGRRSSRGNGVNVLFSGASGTGKTTACEVLAAELGRTLLKIDISQVVSKYVGESEKHLAEAFDIAERSGAVLMFDEADALFGKRTSVSDAHDRYANIEVSYLLQRIEAFRGILVLTTNLQSNIDTAFVRRLQFIVEFAFPDAAQREKIWAICVPAQAPRDPDLDFKALAQRYAVSGGSIRNIALSAAMLAATRGEGIAMRHMAHGAYREFQKLGKALPDDDYFSHGAPR